MFESLPSGSIGAELGVFAGEFTEQICQACEPSRVYAVDFWAGAATSGDVNGDNVKTIDLGRVYEIKCKEWRRWPIEIVRSRTHAWLWEQQPSSLDWVYLDSDHSYGHVANELAAARQAVRNGGWIMGHDFHPHQFPGVVRAVREFARRWNCDISLTISEKLSSFLMVNNKCESEGRATCGVVLQIGIGKRDSMLLDFAGGDIRNWATRHGWQYKEVRENTAAPRGPMWSKLDWELKLSEHHDAILTLDADVMLADVRTPPHHAFQAGGIGVVYAGFANNIPHFNCGVRAVRFDHELSLAMLLAAWADHDRVVNNPWLEQAALHDLQAHFPDVMHPINPCWNYNFSDRLHLGKVKPVFLAYHGQNHRLEKMMVDRESFPLS